MNLLASVQSVLRPFLDPEGDRLLRQVESAMPTLDAGKVQVERWRDDGVGMADVLEERPELRSALAEGISTASRSHWIDLAEVDEIEARIGRQSGLILLTLTLIWGVAAAERALARDGIAANGLIQLLGDAVIAHAADQLSRELGESDLHAELQAAAEQLWALYPSAISAPSADDDQPAESLMAQTLELLGPDPSVTDVLTRELDRTWRLMNISMIGVMYRVIGEQVRKPA